MNLKEEGVRATMMLKGKKVARIYRHRENEMVIKFKDNTMLIVDSKTPLEPSAGGYTDEQVNEL